MKYNKGDIVFITDTHPYWGEATHCVSRCCATEVLHFYEEEKRIPIVLHTNGAWFPLKFLLVNDVTYSHFTDTEAPIQLDSIYNKGTSYISYFYMSEPLKTELKVVGNYLTTDCGELDSIVNLEGEYAMSAWTDELVSEIVSGIDELEELTMPKKSEAPEIPVVLMKATLPEGCKWFSEVFGWEPKKDFPVTIFSGYEHVPEFDPLYKFPRQVTEMLVRNMEMGQAGAMTGMPGTGKTKWAENVAALTGRPFLRIHYNMNLEPEHILGKTGLKKGETKFVEGDLPKFIRMPAIILHDEWTRACAGIGLAIFQSHLEDGSVKLEDSDLGEKRVHAHPNLCIFMADNTLGLGDNLDKFASANVQDTSTINRIGVTARFEYLSEADQTDLVQKYAPSMTKAQANKLAKFAILCQSAYEKGDVPLVFSMRNLQVVSKLAEDTGDIKEAIQYNFLNALDKTSAATVAGFMKTVGI